MGMLYNCTSLNYGEGSITLTLMCVVGSLTPYTSLYYFIFVCKHLLKDSLTNKLLLLFLFFFAHHIFQNCAHLELFSRDIYNFFLKYST